MGLRFRKSISLCKGVRLNFGKTGASISVGGKGYRKTINTKGQVTTSVGIPGTGIYYTDTKSLKNDKSSRSSSSRNSNYTQDYSQSNNMDDAMYVDNASSYQMSSDVENYFASSNGENVVEELMLEDEKIELQPIENTVTYVSKVSISDILKLYTRCDESIDWTEILVSTSAEELFMDSEIWKFYKSVADKVLAGDIDTYLQVIERVRPLDDLLSYGGDFEFGTDNSNVMEIEFNVMPEGVLGDDYNIELLQEYICACSIRVARDIMALLPVSQVNVNTVLENKTILSVKFDKATMLGVNFKSGIMGTDVVKHFEYKMDLK